MLAEKSKSYFKGVIMPKYRLTTKDIKEIFFEDGILQAQLEDNAKLNVIKIQGINKRKELYSSFNIIELAIDMREEHFKTREMYYYCLYRILKLKEQLYFKQKN